MQLENEVDPAKPGAAKAGKSLVDLSMDPATEAGRRKLECHKKEIECMDRIENDNVACVLKKCKIESDDTHEEIKRKNEATQLLLKNLMKRGDDKSKASDENKLNQQ